jgi:peptide/nickel transport system permease protein
LKPASSVRRSLASFGRSNFLRRLGRTVLVAFGVMVVAFSLIHLIPGDPVLLLLGDQATPENTAELRRALGLNGGILEQFWTYVTHVLRGDLGTSLVTHLSVTSIVARTLPVTLWLVAMTAVFGTLMSVPLALAAALARGTWFEQVFRVATSMFLGMPVFFSGLLGILLFAISLRLAPVAGYEAPFPGNLRFLWLPALVNCGVLVPILSRVLQTSLLETLEQEFVETAIVHGLPRRILVWRYLLRPSLAPTVAVLGYILGQLLGAAVVVEIIFGLPGIGTELVNGVTGRDYPVVEGIIFVFGLLVVLISFASDSISGWLDPRTRTA